MTFLINDIIETLVDIERTEKKWTAEKKRLWFDPSRKYFSSTEPQCKLRFCWLMDKIGCYTAGSSVELKVYQCSGVGPLSVHSLQTSQKSRNHLDAAGKNMCEKPSSAVFVGDSPAS